jgi:hypothetical protein
MFARNFNENVDAAVATEAQSRVEAHQGRGRAGDHFVGLPNDFFLQTSAAQGTGRRSVRANQHSRARPAITRSFRAHQRRQRHRLSTMKFESAEDVANFFHVIKSTCPA